MRLPAKTPSQIAREDRRAFHEAVFLGSETGTLHQVATSPERAVRDLVRLSGRCHRYWRERGYLFKCRQIAHGTGIAVWVEPRAGNVRQA